MSNPEPNVPASAAGSERSRASGHQVVDVRDTPVSQIMGRPAITVGLHTPLVEALRVFAGYGVRHLVVVDSRGQYAGLLTDRAVAARWAGRQMAFDQSYVSVAYTPDVACVRTSAHLTDAASTMREAGIDAVVVVGEAGEPAGIVTATDLILALAGPAVTTKPDLEERASETHVADD